MSDMKKKSTLLIIAVVSSLLLLGACGTKKVTNPPANTTGTTGETGVTNNNVGTGTETGTGTGKTTGNETFGTKYGFTSFDLDIDTVELTDAIEVNYDEDRTETEAKYENKSENLSLHGDEAMNKLDTIFKDLSLTHDMKEEEVIKKVSDAFGIKDYSTIELEIKYNDQEEKVYKVKK